MSDMPTSYHSISKLSWALEKVAMYILRPNWSEFFSGSTLFLRGCSIITTRIGDGWALALFVMLGDGKQKGWVSGTSQKSITSRSKKS